MDDFTIHSILQIVLWKTNGMPVSKIVFHMKDMGLKDEEIEAGFQFYTYLKSIKKEIKKENGS